MLLQTLKLQSMIQIFGVSQFLMQQSKELQKSPICLDGSWERQKDETNGGKDSRWIAAKRDKTLLPD